MTPHEHPFKPYLILLAALAMTVCLGATYAWSAFVPALRQWTGLGQGAIQFPFSLFYVVFPLTTIFAGTFFARLGPRRCAIAGGLLFGGGWLLASLGSRHFLLTTLGIGLLGGIGVGFAYIVPIATSMLWFPRNKGLITGIAVAGFGGGAALVAQISEAALSQHGTTPFSLFRAFGLAFMVVIVLAGCLMSLPRHVRPQTSHSFLPGGTLKEGSFWVLYLAMFAGLAAGFAVAPNVKQLYQGTGAYRGLNAVALFALANALGRILWGLAFDRLRSATAIRANLIMQAIVLLSATWLLRSSLGLQAFVLLVGFNYGGVLVIYASTAARHWGSERLGPIYGWLFSANAPAALAPLVVGQVFDRLHSFVLPLSAIGIMIILAALPVREKGLETKG